MSEAKNIIKRLVNSTDKLRVNVTELLKLIKTKQDKLPTDGSSEEFLAKDGQYHTVKSSTQSNWEQNDENADDYIKNRPFYKKSETYTFPNADYITPYFSSEEIDLIVYKIADEFIKLKTFEGSMLTGHVESGDPETTELTSDGQDSNLYEERDEETGELLCVALCDVFFILYEDFPVSEDGSEVIPPGVYFAASLSNDPTVVILDSIDITVDLKQIDKKFIPSLDYASVDDVESARNIANQANSRANAAFNWADQAYGAAINAATKADQAQNNIKIANILSIESAKQLFANMTFESPPVGTISSEDFTSAFDGCNKMIDCSIYGYKGLSVYIPKLMNGTFRSCSELKIIGGCLDLIECSDFTSAFSGCTSLTHITSIYNISASINFSDCPLGDETVNKILNALRYNSSFSRNPVLTLRSDILEKLTDEQISRIPSQWSLG